MSLLCLFDFSGDYHFHVMAVCNLNELHSPPSSFDVDDFFNWVDVHTMPSSSALASVIAPTQASPVVPGNPTIERPRYTAARVREIFGDLSSSSDDDRPRVQQPGPSKCANVGVDALVSSVSPGSLDDGGRSHALMTIAPGALSDAIRPIYPGNAPATPSATLCRGLPLDPS